jgi:squalene synthase HpnC
MPVNHYENFPVASILLPARLRPAVEVIYAFARSADDLADEGHALREERLDALSAYERGLDTIERMETPEPGLFRALARIIDEYRLPLRPFRDLISAFKQDVVTLRYPTFAHLNDYCKRSANPVGALMLHLYDAASPENLIRSDAICSALQLINFWQDVAIDWEKSRIYLPQEDLRHFAVGETHLSSGKTDDAWRALMRFEVERARKLMHFGLPLALNLPGRIGWELRLVIQGGLRILERIELADYDVFKRRPSLGKADWPLLFWRALRMK